MAKTKILPIVATTILAGAMFFAGCEKGSNNVEFNSKPTLAYGYSGSTLTGIVGFDVYLFSNDADVRTFIDTTYYYFLNLVSDPDNFQEILGEYDSVQFYFENYICNIYPDYANLSEDNQELVMEFAEECGDAPGKIQGFKKFMKKVTKLQEERDRLANTNQCMTEEEYIRRYNYWVEWLNNKNHTIIINPIPTNS